MENPENNGLQKAVSQLSSYVWGSSEEQPRAGAEASYVKDGASVIIQAFPSWDGHKASANTVTSQAGRKKKL